MPQINMPQEAQETTAVEPIEPSLVIPEGEYMRDQLARTFNLSASEVSQYKTKLDTLIEYAKLKTDDHTPEGIKWAIRQLGVKVGTPPLGEKLINYLNLYARLYLEGHRINKEKEKFLRGEIDT